MSKLPLGRILSLLLIAQGCGATSQQPTAEPTECEPCPECAAPEPTVVATPEPDPVDDEPLTPVVTAGACNTSWLPPGLVAAQTDEETGALIEMVRGWLEERNGPAYDVGRGTLFAKSEDDLGADPPYPTFALRGAEHACGSQQLWVAERARRIAAMHASPEMGEGVRCDDNVCCYDAVGEYDSGGTLVFSLDAESQRWVLRAYAVVADNGTLGQAWIDAERTYVSTSLRRLMRRRCRGEPPIVW